MLLIRDSSGVASADEVKTLNAHTVSMASRIVMSPVEMIEIPAVFQGEYQNIKHKVDRPPKGLI